MSRPAPLPRLHHRARSCDICGDPYLRRNLVEAWTSQNQGHRAGWTKTILRVCVACGPEAQARRLVITSHARFRDR